MKLINYYDLSKSKKEKNIKFEIETYIKAIKKSIFFNSGIKKLSINEGKHLLKL